MAVRGNKSWTEATRVKSFGRPCQANSLINDALYWTTWLLTNLTDDGKTDSQGLWVGLDGVRPRWGCQIPNGKEGHTPLEARPWIGHTGCCHSPGQWWCISYWPKINQYLERFILLTCEIAYVVVGVEVTQLVAFQHVSVPVFSVVRIV